MSTPINVAILDDHQSIVDRFTSFASKLMPMFNTIERFEPQDGAPERDSATKS